MCVCVHVCIYECVFVSVPFVSFNSHCHELKNKLRRSVWGVTLSLLKQCERVNVVANFELDRATNATTQTSGKYRACKSRVYLE